MLTSEELARQSADLQFAIAGWVIGHHVVTNFGRLDTLYNLSGTGK